MLGRNHAVYAAAGWAAAWSWIDYIPTVDVDVTDPGLFTMSVAVAAGAGVVPDLDHPDARPSKHFGFLSRFVAKGISSAAGGHRWGTHSLAFAALAATATYVLSYIPGVWGAGIVAICTGFCASVGLALVGPSLGFKVPAILPLAVFAAFVWLVAGSVRYGEPLQEFLWVIAAYGIIAHIACDAVTKGGVPLFWPWTRRKFALGLFRVGGTGENVASFIGIALLIWSTYSTVRFF